MVTQLSGLCIYLLESYLQSRAEEVLQCERRLTPH